MTEPEPRRRQKWRELLTGRLADMLARGLTAEEMAEALMADQVIADAA